MIWACQAWEPRGRGLCDQGAGPGGWQDLDGWVWPEGGKGGASTVGGGGLRDGGGIWMVGVWSKGGQRRERGGTRTAWGQGRAGPGGAGGGLEARRRCVSDAEVRWFRRARRAATAATTRTRRIVASLVLAAGGAGRGRRGRARGPRGHRGAERESGPGMASARPPGRACAAIARARGLRAGPPALPAAAAASPSLRAARRPRSARCSTCCAP